MDSRPHLPERVILRVEAGSISLCKRQRGVWCAEGPGFGPFQAPLPPAPFSLQCKNPVGKQQCTGCLLGAGSTLAWQGPNKTKAPVEKAPSSHPISSHGQQTLVPWQARCRAFQCPRFFVPSPAVIGACVHHFIQSSLATFPYHGCILQSTNHWTMKRVLTAELGCWVSRRYPVFYQCPNCSGVNVGTLGG